ncbi:RNA polymerase sigma-H factor [compost metagenome]
MVSVNLEKWVRFDYEIQSDEEIVEAVREGDSEALEYLINKYRSVVRAKAGS